MAILSICQIFQVPSKNFWDGTQCAHIIMIIITLLRALNYLRSPDFEIMKQLKSISPSRLRNVLFFRNVTCGEVVEGRGSYSPCWFVYLILYFPLMNSGIHYQWCLFL